MNRISVIGVGPGGLSRGARKRLARAAVVAGGARQLAAHASPAARQVPIGGDLALVLEALTDDPGPAVVLASGDPGFFGIVRALAEHFGRQQLDVLPGVSNVSAAFARAGVPWDDALVVSAHGRDARAAIHTALAHPKVAILTSPGTPPSRLAAALDGSNRLCIVAEHLGEPGERLTEGTPAEIAAGRFADPNVLLVLDPARAVGERALSWPPRTQLRWALEEDAFEHRDSMVTKIEVRALALARLGPGTGDLLWDVGAGSGSVAIECARLGAAAIAIERDPDACRLIAANAERHHVDVRVVAGEAPAALVALPDPDAVFVGGGGETLDAILDLCAARARRAVVVTLALVERAGPALERLSTAGLQVDATLVQASRLRPLAGGHRLAPENPVVVITGRRP